MSAIVCPVTVAPGLASRLLADTDCQAFGLVERGYAALAAPGGPVAAAVTGLLVLAVALFGYRLLLGRGLLLSNAVGLALKIGVVLLISTSWDSWQAVAYDGLARAPTQIAGELLSGMAARDPVLGLQGTLDSIESASIGYRTRAGIASPLVGGPAAAAMTLNLSGLMLTISTVGILVAARLVLALMLAIAPVMAGFILFDSTRGMTAGWLGAMAAAALVPLFVLTIAAIELSILDPMLARLLSEQGTGRFDTASVTPIGLVTIIFMIAMIFAMRAAARMTRGIRLPSSGSGRPAIAEPAISLRAAPPMTSEPPAVLRVVQALETIARRDEAGTGPGARGTINALSNSGSRGTQSPSAMTDAYRVSPTRHPAPIRTPRRSRAAGRRDA